MGYKTPLVCKEIYIPCDEDFLLTSPTLEQYKEKYGIDLVEIFNIEFRGSETSPRVELPEDTKVYFCAKNYSDLTRYSPKIGIPNVAFEESAGHSVIIGVYISEIDQGQYLLTSCFGIMIKPDGTLNPLVL